MPFKRPSNPVILMLGLNAIALAVLILVIIGPAASPPAKAVSATAPSPGSALRPAAPAATPSWIKSWFVPLSGPLRIGIQVGHLDNLDLPTEQRHLRGNDGAIVKKVMEWQINQRVGQALTKRLAGKGMDIVILPATIPPGLRLDAFVAIHCDWADRPKNRGWKVSAPALGNRASEVLATSIAASFTRESYLRHDLALVGDKMYDYYAFNWRTYRHALSPLTPAVIVELGFMSNPDEFKLLTASPDSYAAILERGIRQFLAKTSRTDTAMLVPPP